MVDHLTQKFPGGPLNSRIFPEFSGGFLNSSTFSLVVDTLLILKRDPGITNFLIPGLRNQSWDCNH